MFPELILNVCFHQKRSFTSRDYRSFEGLLTARSGRSKNYHLINEEQSFQLYTSFNLAATIATVSGSIGVTVV